MMDANKQAILWWMAKQNGMTLEILTDPPFTGPNWDATRENARLHLRQFNARLDQGR